MLGTGFWAFLEVECKATLTCKVLATGLTVASLRVRSLRANAGRVSGFELARGRSQVDDQMRSYSLVICLPRFGG